MQTVKHCAVIFKEPWPMGPMATPVTPSMALSRLPFYVSLSLWAEDSKQCPPPTPAVCSVTHLRGGVKSVLTRGD